MSIQKLTGKKKHGTKNVSILDEIQKGFQVAKGKEERSRRQEAIKVQSMNIDKIVVFIVVFSFYALIMHQLLKLLPREMNIFSSIAFSFLNVWLVYVVLHISGIDRD